MKATMEIEIEKNLKAKSYVELESTYIKVETESK
jgi:hypothetical protein